MRIFLDTGDVEAIRRVNDTGLLDGVTTNPTHIAKTGRSFHEVVKEICSIVSGPVSVEAMGETVEELLRAAERASVIAPNIAIKIPMTVDGLRAVPILEEKEIPCNVTMIFSSTQCFLAMKAGATFVSLVISRLDAVANEGDILIDDAVTVKRNFGFSSDILAASLKTQNHVLACLRAGVDVVTLPEALFFQMYKHPLTDIGLSQFAKDWESVPK